MRPTLRVVGLVVALVAAGQVLLQGQERQRDVRFKDYPVTTVSVVVRDADRSAQAWADVLGVAVPAVVEAKGLPFPPSFDQSAVLRMTTLRMANMFVSLHQPSSGNSYWKAVLDAQGEALYRLNFRVNGMADHVRYLERKGGELVVGQHGGTFTNVNLWPKFGFAVELGEGPAPAASSTSPLSGTPVFASNPVFKIAFVVPDLAQAVKDYADLFGFDAPPIMGTLHPTGFPQGTTVDRSASVKTAIFRLPNGIDLELNEPQGGQSVWRAHLESHGRSLFSVGVRVSSVEGVLPYLTSKGGKLVLGAGGARYAFFDFVSRLGTILEVHE